MTPEETYRQIQNEIPGLEDMRKLYNADPGAWQSMILAVYKQGRVDQLGEWIKTRSKEGE